MSKPRKPRGTQNKQKSSRAAKVPEVVTPEYLEEEREKEEHDDDERDDDEIIEAELVEESTSGDRSGFGVLVPSPVSHRGGEEDGTAEQLPVPDTTGLVGEQRDLLKRYLQEVSRYSLLSPEEEFELAVRLRDSGDLEAARRLVSANLRLVVKIAMEYRSAYQNVMDLIQEGNVGLMKAVSKFDPAKGAKLSYYASWWIRSYILKYILDNFRLVKVGTTQAQKKLFFHLMREKERLEAQGLEAGPKLLADRLNVREKDVVEMEQRLSGRGAEMSLDNPVGTGDSDESTTTHLDLLADDHESPDDNLAHEELKNILKSRLDDFAKTLKEKEFAVFRERLAAEQPKTLQEVADLFGLTRERARQIEAKVIEKLREYYKKYIR